jgi:hypothetical protein
MLSERYMILRLCSLFFIVFTCIINNLNGSDSDGSSAGAGSGAGIDHHSELRDYIRSYTEQSNKRELKVKLCQKLNAALATYDIKTTNDAKRFEEILATFIETNCFILQSCKKSCKKSCEKECKKHDPADKEEIVISSKGWELYDREEQDLFSWLIAFLDTHNSKILTEICTAHWEKQVINITLWEGISKDNLAQVNDALDKGANPNMWVYCFDKSYRTCDGCNYNDHHVGSKNPIFHRALDLATQIGNVEIIKALMHKGASILMQNASRNTAIYWTRYSFECPNVKVIEALIQTNYAELLKLMGRKKKSVLTECRKKMRAKLRKIYLDYPSDSDSLSDSEDSSGSESDEPDETGKPRPSKKTRRDSSSSGSDSDGAAGAGGPSSTDGTSGPAVPSDFINWAAGLVGEL